MRITPSALDCALVPMHVVFLDSVCEGVRSVIGINVPLLCPLSNLSGKSGRVIKQVLEWRWLSNSSLCRCFIIFPHLEDFSLLLQRVHIYLTPHPPQPPHQRRGTLCSSYTPAPLANPPQSAPLIFIRLFDKAAVSLEDSLR